jgi:hypothetical protein
MRKPVCGLGDEHGVLQSTFGSEEDENSRPEKTSTPAAV